MGLVSIPYTFTVGAVIIASQHNSNFSTIYSEFNGNIQDANIASNASISDSKLAQITSAGKISGAAITSLSSVPSGAGQLPGVNGGVPSGAIFMWSGTIATIPSGYYLCNGSNSTPDLRNLFIVGADADSGGVAKTTLTGAATQSGGNVNHTHTIPNAGGIYTDGGAIDGGISRSATSFSNIIGNTITSNNNSTVAVPYYALAFIMKS